MHACAGDEESEQRTVAPLDALKEAQEQVAKTQNQVIKAQKQVSKAQEEIIKAQQQVSKAQQQVFNAQQQVSMAKQQVCTALKNISSDKHGKDVSRAGGVEAVLQALKQYKADPQVQQDGCSALWKLCRDGEACRRAGEAGAVQATIEVLKTYTDKVHAPVQVQACSAMRVLCSDEENKIRADATEAIEAIVDMLTAHPLNAQVQREGCAALSVLCHDNKWKSLYHDWAYSTVKAVLEALKAHPFDEKFQVEGCGAIAELCEFCQGVSSNGLIAGALETIMKALKTHKANPRVQEKACAALQGCVVHSYQQRFSCELPRAGKTGAVKAVVEALKAHPFDEKVQVEGCEAIAELCQVCHKNQSRALDAGALEIIVEALKTHSANAQVRGETFETMKIRLLRTLLDPQRHQFESDQRRVVAAGGIEAIVEAMKAHGTDERVQRYGCGVLATLCKGDDGEITRRAGSAGGVEVALEALRNHTTDEVLSDGIHFLWCLCVTLPDDDFLYDAMQLGAVSVVQDVLAVQNVLEKEDSVTHGLGILHAVGTLKEVSQDFADALAKNDRLRERFFEQIEMSEFAEVALGRAWGTNMALSLDFTKNFTNSAIGDDIRIGREANRAREYELQRRERLLAFGMGVLPRLGGGSREAGSTGASSKALLFDGMGRDVFKLIADAYGAYVFEDSNDRRHILG